MSDRLAVYQLKPGDIRTPYGEEYAIYMRCPSDIEGFIFMHEYIVSVPKYDDYKKKTIIHVDNKMHQYFVFPSIAALRRYESRRREGITDLIPWRGPNLTLNEVRRSNQAQKLFFDIDLPRTAEITNEMMERNLIRLRDLILYEFKNHYSYLYGERSTLLYDQQIEIHRKLADETPSDWFYPSYIESLKKWRAELLERPDNPMPTILIYSRSRAEKYSFHVIIDGYYGSNLNEAHLFCEEVMKVAQPYAEFAWLCADKVVDMNVYGEYTNESKIHCLRLPGHTKVGEENYKRLILAYEGYKPIDISTIDPSRGETLNLSGCRLLIDKVTPEKIKQHLAKQDKIGESLKPAVMKYLLEHINADRYLGDNIWYSVGGAVKSTGIDSGCDDIMREIFRGYMEKNPKYDKDKFDDGWRNLEPHKVGPGYLIKLFKEDNSIPTDTKWETKIPSDLKDVHVKPTIQSVINKVMTKEQIIDVPEGMNVSVYCDTSTYPYWFGCYDTLFIKACKGMRKTQRLAQLVGRFGAPDINTGVANWEYKKILVLSYRISLTEAFMPQFKVLGFKSYRDLPKKQPINENRLFISVDSLWRLDPTYKPDLVVIDESEEAIYNLTKPGMAHAQSIMAVYENLMKETRHLICMDANLSRLITIDNILKFRNIEKCSLRYNEYKKFSDHTCELLRDNKVWHSKILDAVFKEGLSLVIPMNSKDEAGNLNEVLHKAKGAYANTGSILYIDAKTIKLNNEAVVHNDKERRAILGRLGPYMVEKGVRVFIYTPTIEAGVSINEDIFDVCYAYFTDHSNGYKACDQMLGRVRNLRQKKFVICTKATEHWTPNDIEEWMKAANTNMRHEVSSRFRVLGSEVSEHLVKSIENGEWVYKHTDHWYYKLCQAANFDNLLSEYKFEECLFGCLYHVSGIKLVSIENQYLTSAAERMIKVAKKEAKLAEDKRRAIDVKNAEFLTQDQYNHLKCQQTISYKDQCSVELYEIMEAYGLKSRPEVEFVYDYGTKKQCKQFREAARFARFGVKGVLEEAAARDIKNLNQHEATAVSAKTYYRKYQVAMELLRNIGFDGPLDDKRIQKRHLDVRLDEAKQYVKENWNDIKKDFNYKYQGKGDVLNWKLQQYVYLINATVGNITGFKLMRVNPCDNGGPTSEYWLYYDPIVLRLIKKKNEALDAEQAVILKELHSTIGI